MKRNIRALEEEEVPVMPILPRMDGKVINHASLEELSALLIERGLAPEVKAEVDENDMDAMDR